MSNEIKSDIGQAKIGFLLSHADWHLWYYKQMRFLGMDDLAWKAIYEANRLIKESQEILQSIQN